MRAAIALALDPTAARTRAFTVGTFSSLAPWLFPALEELMDGATVHQVVEHGDRLTESVGEGSLDAAFVAVANQMRLPATVSAVPVGSDRLAVLTPAGVPVGKGRRSFAGLDVVAYTYDMSTGIMHERLCELGARPRTAATAETAVRMARLLKCPAVLPADSGAPTHRRRTGCPSHPCPATSHFSWCPAVPPPGNSQQWSTGSPAASDYDALRQPVTPAEDPPLVQNEPSGTWDSAVGGDRFSIAELVRRTRRRSAQAPAQWSRILGVRRGPLDQYQWPAAAVSVTKSRKLAVGQPCTGS